MNLGFVPVTLYKYILKLDNVPAKLLSGAGYIMVHAYLQL